jgi:hypothetical protein
MDSYGQIGPEKPDYQRDLEAIASELLATHGAAVVVVSFAARDTQKHIALGRMRHMEIRGDRPPGFADTNDALFVGVANGRCAFLPMAWLHPSYVQQYLGTPFGADPDPLTEFLNALLGRMGYVPAELTAAE